MGVSKLSAKVFF